MKKKKKRRKKKGKISKLVNQLGINFLKDQNTESFFETLFDNSKKKESIKANKLKRKRESKNHPNEIKNKKRKIISKNTNLSTKPTSIVPNDQEKKQNKKIPDLPSFFTQIKKEDLLVIDKKAKQVESELESLYAEKEQNEKIKENQSLLLKMKNDYEEFKKQQLMQEEKQDIQNTEQSHSNVKIVNANPNTQQMIDRLRKRAKIESFKNEIFDPRRYKILKQDSSIAGIDNQLIRMAKDAARKEKTYMEIRNNTNRRARGQYGWK